MPLHLKNEIEMSKFFNISEVSNCCLINNKKQLYALFVIVNNKRKSNKISKMLTYLCSVKNKNKSQNKSFVKNEIFCAPS